MIYRVAQSKGTTPEWRVEAINYDGEGEIYVTLFSGPKAQQRALEYAYWKQGLMRKKNVSQFIQEQTTPITWLSIWAKLWRDKLKQVR